MRELFVMESCPYCQKVLKSFDENSVDYTVRDISDRENYEALISLGGKEQVPFLYDEENDVKMYESDDIINYVLSK